MPKVVRDDKNRFRSTWQSARQQGIERGVMAESLGIERGRLNDLILGRARPTLGEASALSGRRPSTLIRYRDVGGAYHGAYTGRGISFEDLVESGQLDDLLEDIGSERSYDEVAAITELIGRSPGRRPDGTRARIHPLNRGLRKALR